MADGDHALRGQWALITGAAKRIGAAIAKSLHGAGAGVAVHYRGSGAAAEQLCHELNGIRPNSSFPLQADLNQTPQLTALVYKELYAWYDAGPFQFALSISMLLISC